MKTLRTLFVATALVLAGGLASAGPTFFDDFEGLNPLDDWTGQGGYDTADHGAIVADPLNSGNNVLKFTQTNAGGDIFSIATVTSLTGEYVLSFDYLGCSQVEPGANCEGGSDLGGFAGLSQDFPGTHWWIAGTQPGALSVLGPDLDDDGQWHHYEIFFSGTATELHVMLEDFNGSGGSAGDAYFDNVRLEAVPEPGSLVLIGSGLAGLALRRRRRS